MLRYRFDTVAQLHAHLHQLEGHSVLFFRDPSSKLNGGDRALLEVAFTSSEQQAFLRGNVISRVEGSIPGLWLEFSDTRLARKLADGAAGIASRKQRRLPVDMMVEVKPYGGTRFVGRLLDVSLGGARLAGTHQLQTRLQVELRLLSPPDEVPADLGRAEVMRVLSGETALHFLRADSGSRVALTRLFDSVRKSWMNARELVHPSLCCRDGKPVEPPLPRLKKSEG